MRTGEACPLDTNAVERTSTKKCRAGDDAGGAGGDGQ